MDAPIAVYYSKPNPKLKIVGDSIGRMEYGIALRKQDTALLAEINRALLALIQAGELRRIYDNWGIWNKETSELFEQLAPGSQALATPSAPPDRRSATLPKTSLNRWAGANACNAGAFICRPCYCKARR